MSIDESIDTTIISQAQADLGVFWTKVMDEVKSITQNDLRQQELPLARIKRIMKIDDDVKMISAEAPALFSKAVEIFITELTLRAWVHTEDNKRRTLQRNDIAMAITKYDQFDFLIDIVPRDEVKPSKPRDQTGISTDQHYFQIAQHYQTVLQNSISNNNTNTSTSTTATSAAPQSIQIVQAGGQVQTVQEEGKKKIEMETNTDLLGLAAIHQAQTAATTTTNVSQVSTQAQPQVIQVQPQQQVQQTTANSGGIQIIQQIVGANGQIQQIPIQLTPQQLQMIRMQMTGATQQPIIIQTAPIQAVNQPTTQTSGSSQSQIIQLQQVNPL